MRYIPGKLDLLPEADVCSRFNAALAAARRENDRGHYDIYTNAVQWPRAMQPTHARWETTERESADEQNNELKAAVHGVNEGEYDVDQELSSIFKKLDPVYPRNFMIQDLSLEGAPESKFGPPGCDYDPQSLSNLPRAILDELPGECRQAFEEARRQEMSWRSRWNTENTDGKRGRFMPTVEWFP